MQRRIVRHRRPYSTIAFVLLSVLMLSAFAMPRVAPAQTLPPTQTPTTPGTYTNPLNLRLPDGSAVESCADPAVIRGQQAGDTNWYLYCTKDPLNDADRNDQGGYNFHNIPMFVSQDLINWRYAGDAFAAPPAWGELTAGVWAPEIDYLNNKYYLYYTLTDTKPDVSGAPNCGGDSAIGVATSPSPTGPWTDLGRPVVAPRYNGDPAKQFGARDCNFLWTFDPDVLTTNTGERYIYYGSYYGGIQVRPLSADGFTTDPAAAVQVTIPNRYEGTYVVQRDNYYYLFASASNCCNGPLTGYSVFAGRSASPTGPFVDRQGVSLLATRVGGTPVISMNGNRWVGTGHNTLLRDFGGQYWMIYHAVDRNNPYFADAPGNAYDPATGNDSRLTKRPALIDPLDWVNGWPTVRGGFWASDTPQPAPAAQPGQRSAYQPQIRQPDRLGNVQPSFGDEFNGTSLDPQWTWVRPPLTDTYGLENGTFRFDTQAADLYQTNNTASVLTRPAPSGDYVVETKVKLNVPDDGSIHNFVQAGVLIYGDDNTYVRLMQVSIWETRQTEFGKEYVDPLKGPFYGSTVVGPPSGPNGWTWLRIVKRTRGNEELYTAYTSRDGIRYVRGGTWTHQIGAHARIGLAAMGGSGFTANFDYVRVFRLMDYRTFAPMIGNGP